MSDRIELRMSPELLARLDKARGETPRGTFIKRALEQALDGPVPFAGWPPQTEAEVKREQRAEKPVANVLGSPVRKVPKSPSLKDTWGR